MPETSSIYSDNYELIIHTFIIFSSSFKGL